MLAPTSIGEVRNHLLSNGIGNGTKAVLPLRPEHLQDLRASGLSDAQIRACGFRTITDLEEIQKVLRWKSYRGNLGPCLVIPYPGTDYARLKPSKPRQDKTGKSIKYEAPKGAGNRAYFPPGTAAALTDPKAVLLLTEGEKKAAKADQDGFSCIGLAGVYAWQQCRPKDADGKATGPRQLIEDLECVTWQGRTVFIVFDSDAVTNKNVRWAEWHLAQALAEKGATVLVVRLPPGPNDAKVGLDDYLVAEGPDALRQLLAEAKPAEIPEQEPLFKRMPDGDSDKRPEIAVTPEEHEVNGAALDALAKEENLFCRKGQGLVRLVRSREPIKKKGVQRPAEHIEIVNYSPAILSEALTRHAFFTKPDKRGMPVQCHPPKFMVNALLERGEWPDLRYLEAVVESPALREDGTILSEPGYDPQTGLYLSPTVSVPPVPDRPTADQVRNALRLLMDMVCDFPFAKPEHQSAYLAFLLTPLARHAFNGPAPLFLVDANIRGAGKGLLCHTVAIVATGRRAPISSYPSNDEEMRKRITTIAMSGDQLMLIDNISGKFGSPALDSALTGTEWTDRILGVTAKVCLPLTTVWCATGNNIQIVGDMSRRVCHIRLESPVENPEEREGFRHHDLMSHVQKNRGELLSAALTLLRGWFSAGQPRAKLKAWGSYEGWSALVRNVIVWAGLPDPGLTRTELREMADDDGPTVRAILFGLAYLDPNGRGLTVKEIINELKDNAANAQHTEVVALRDALANSCRTKGVDLPNTHAVGCTLRKFRGRVAGGLRLFQPGEQKKVALWAVQEMG